MTAAPMPPRPTIYFGYGSNLWLHQMRQRCPTSQYLGIARLKGYKWIINDRGYANIVELKEEEEEEGQSQGRSCSSQAQDYTSEVWGLVYRLEEEDESRLDMNEGVPTSYEKEFIECEHWAASVTREIMIDTHDRLAYASIGAPDTRKEAEKLDMLIYINRELVVETLPREEYIVWMNMGINDAVREGVPEEYVQQVLRKFIPDIEVDRSDVEEEARRQAREFDDTGYGGR